MIKIFLVVVSFLMATTLVLVVYIWWQLQTLKNPTFEEQVTEDSYVKQPNDLSSKEETTITTESNPVASQISEPIRITPDNLTESQQQALDAIGVDIEGITITQSMVVCAEDELGSERLSEILDGARPGPLESLILLGCTKQ